MRYGVDNFIKELLDDYVLGDDWDKSIYDIFDDSYDIFFFVCDIEEEYEIEIHSEELNDITLNDLIKLIRERIFIRFQEILKNEGYLEEAISINETPFGGNYPKANNGKIDQVSFDGGGSGYITYILADNTLFRIFYSPNDTITNSPTIHFEKYTGDLSERIDYTKFTTDHQGSNVRVSEFYGKLLYVLLNAFSPYLEDEISFYGAENSRQSKVYTTILNSKAFNNLMSSIDYFYDIDKSRTVNSGDERGIVTVHTYSRKGNNNV